MRAPEKKTQPSRVARINIQTEIVNGERTFYFQSVPTRWWVKVRVRVSLGVKVRDSVEVRVRVRVSNILGAG